MSMKIGEKVLAELRAHRIVCFTTWPSGDQLIAQPWTSKPGGEGEGLYGSWRVVVKRRGKPPIVGIVSTRSGHDRAHIVEARVIGRGRAPGPFWTAWRNIVGSIV